MTNAKLIERARETTTAYNSFYLLELTHAIADALEQAHARLERVRKALLNEVDASSITAPVKVVLSDCIRRELEERDE